MKLMRGWRLAEAKIGRRQLNTNPGTEEENRPSIQRISSQRLSQRPLT
jgi:hypothetical protein